MSESMRSNVILSILGGVFILTNILVPTPCEAFIMISEFLADPAAGILGDANQDGHGSSYQDEFVELFNLGDEAVDLSGWSISDGLKVRHIFDEQAFLPAHSFYVVFGGGQPCDFPGIWEKSSTGSLSLNNSGDHIYIYDQGEVLIDMVTYGVNGNNNQSLMRILDGQSEDFILHGDFEPAGGALFSPGFGYGENFNGIEDPGTTSVPEFPTGIYFVSVFLPYLVKRICLSA
ncbi:MAG: lamin tail domain-containing protein [Candidatus Omnitrophica bacterium]|nr:lamin tail domain-containing protein [Candidatus Omnitrophota bacterium]